MEDLCVQLTDITDEILLLTLKKLTNNEVLYSLIGVNIRLDNIASDPIFTEHLKLMRRSSNDTIYSLDDSILDRFCSAILPRVHRTIKSLNLESFSVERILLAAEYPNLHGLALFNIERETVLRLFVGKTHLDRLFKNQIIKLDITLADNVITTLDIMNILCSYVLTKFSNLICLKLHSYSGSYIDSHEQLSFNSRELATFFSSSLMELHINVHSFTDGLHLLDGRFKQLHTLHVNVYWLVSTSEAIINQEELIHLKCFSLMNKLYAVLYEEIMVPLLCRISNLEELFLNLTIGRVISRGSFINGDNLKNDIINHMPKLNNFVFSIHSNLSVADSSRLPSNEEIQRTLKGLDHYQITSYVDYFPEEQVGQCDMYSHPYTMNSFYRLTNSFSGGLFPSVHKVSLLDERPFEHEFFLRIAQACPFLRILVIDNQSPQTHKKCQQSNENHRNLPITNYAHLTQLDLFAGHDDYIEQFLDDTRTCLSNYIQLNLYYYKVQKVINNFIRDATRINCAKVKYLYNIERCDVPKHFHTYFPHLEK